MNLSILLASPDFSGDDWRNETKPEPLKTIITADLARSLPMPNDKTNRLHDLDHFLRTPLVTDARGDPFGLNRPGYRFLVDAPVTGVKEEAYRDYLDYVTNAWKGNPPQDGRRGR